MTLEELLASIANAPHNVAVPIEPVLLDLVLELERHKLIKKQLRDTKDAVNHPPHYTQHPSGVECIQITRHMSFNLGNAMKYIWRADLKNNAIQDLEKARWYIEDEIRRRESRGQKNATKES